MRTPGARRSLAGVALLIALAATRSAAETARGVSVSIEDETGERVALYDESHALVIGISSYVEGWSRLEGVRRDVAAVAPVLERHGFQVEVIEDPSRAEFLAAVEGFVGRHGFGTRNRLLIYVAGHGHTESQAYGGEMGYLVTADAAHPDLDRQDFLSKAVSMQEIESFARRMQSLHALFVFDACFAGTIFTTVRSAAPPGVSYKAARPVRQFISSGSANEEVPDDSIFRAQFVEALEGEADVNRDGYVTGTELGEFLQEKVITYTDGAQHPQHGKLRDRVLDKGDFVFELPSPARRAGPTKRLLEGTRQTRGFPYRLELRDSASERALENGSVVPEGAALDLKLVRDPAIAAIESEAFFFQVIVVDQAWNVGRLIRDSSRSCGGGVHSFGAFSTDVAERTLQRLRVFPPFGNDFFILVAATEREALCDLLSRPVADLLVADPSSLSGRDAVLQRLWIRSAAPLPPDRRP